MKFFSQALSFFLLLLFLASCSTNSLYVQQERVGKSYLASSHVVTPDPLQRDPPCGQNILVQWKLPQELFVQRLSLQLRVKFWDHTEEIREQKPLTRQGTGRFFFPFQEKRGTILTYKVEVITEQGEVIDEWVHKFWNRSICL